MKIAVLIHAENAKLLETYLSRIAEKENCTVRKDSERLAIKINSDEIEFLMLEYIEQYKETRLSANIVFYPNEESDRVFILMAYGFNVRNLNTVIPQLPFLEYDEVHFAKVMKDRLKYVVLI